MRWTMTEFKPENYGDIRRIAVFLLFPRNINGEWRWLEHVIIQQRNISKDLFNYWLDEKWIDG